jgi:hypothetical protein
VIKKANDQQEGVLTSFRLEAYEFDVDEDGDQFRTFIVSGDDVPAVPAVRQRLSDKQRLAMDCLAEVTLSHGVALQRADMPAGLKSVTADQWFDELCRRRVIDPDRPNSRTRFSELRTSFNARRLIGVDGDLVWLVFEGKTETGSFG